MLKSKLIELAGKDEGRSVLLREQPALIADGCARSALRRIGADPDGGIVALALRHLSEVRSLGDEGLRLLQRFVNVDNGSLAFVPKDWRNIEKIQQAALALHVGFIVDRELIDIPVAMRAEQILDSVPDVRATFCSPHIAAVLESGKATYRELETVLSTEDCFNIVEILNVRAVHDWHAAQQSKT